MNATEPLSPEFRHGLLAKLDKEHQKAGDYEDWMMSDKRKEIAGPNHHVRVINWRNIDEVCAKANMDVHKMSDAYREAVATGDVIFVTYEEEPNA